MAGQELLYVTSVRSQKGLGTLQDKRQKSARTLYMEAHAQEVRQGTNAEGKAMLQGGGEGGRGGGGREDGMSPTSILTFRNDTEITQGFQFPWRNL